MAFEFFFDWYQELVKFYLCEQFLDVDIEVVGYIKLKPVECGKF